MCHEEVTHEEKLLGPVKFLWWRSDSKPKVSFSSQSFQVEFQPTPATEEASTRTSDHVNGPSSRGPNRKLGLEIVKGWAFTLPYKELELIKKGNIFLTKSSLGHVLLCSSFHFFSGGRDSCLTLALQDDPDPLQRQRRCFQMQNKPRWYRSKPSGITIRYGSKYLTQLIVHHRPTKAWRVWFGREPTQISGLHLKLEEPVVWQVVPQELHLGEMSLKGPVWCFTL